MSGQAGLPKKGQRVFLSCSRPGDNVPGRHSTDRSDVMPPDQSMQPATDEEIINSLALALGYSGGRRAGAADQLTAHIAAEHLLRHLKQCGYVVMKGPGTPPKTPEWG